MERHVAVASHGAAANCVCRGTEDGFPYYHIRVVHYAPVTTGAHYRRCAHGSSSCPFAVPSTRVRTQLLQVKASRETRNRKLVEFLNTVLSGSSGAVYFKTAGDASAFEPITVAAVAAWAVENANLAEPTSLGRPHFSKYVDKVRNNRRTPSLLQPSYPYLVSTAGLPPHRRPHASSPQTSPTS